MDERPSDGELPVLPLVLSEVHPGMRLALALEGVPQVDFRPHERRGAFVLWDRKLASAPALAPGQRAIEVSSLREGAIDPCATLLDTRGTWQQWDCGRLAVMVNAARYDKRQSRRRIVLGLRRLLDAAGGVWIRVAPCPYPYRSAFHLRFDYRATSATDVVAVRRLVEGYEGATSHCLNPSHFRPFPAALELLRGLELSQSGYVPEVYEDFESNLRNILAGRRALQAMGLEPTGFAGADGVWSPQLAAALSHLDVPFSSEVGLCHDEWPYVPLVAALSGQPVWQVPTHALPLDAIFTAAEREFGDRPWRREQTVDLAVEHWTDLLRRKQQAGEPALFTTRPELGPVRFPRLLEELLRTASGLGDLWRTSQRELVAWSRVRSETSVCIRRQQDQLICHCDRIPANYPLGLEWLRGNHLATWPLLAETTHIGERNLVFVSRPEVTLPSVVRIDSAHAPVSHGHRRWSERWTESDQETDRAHWSQRAAGWLRRLAG